MATKPRTEAQLARAAKAFLAAGGNYTKAGRALGITAPTLRAQIEDVRKRFPKLLPVEPPPMAPRAAVPEQAKPAATAAEVMQAHRADQRAAAALHQVAVLREALAASESKLLAFTALRGAKVDHLAWAMPKPALRKRATLMPLLMLSDFQTGEVIKPAELDGMNAYNTDIFHGAADFPGCIYAQLGDVISGGLHLDLSETDDLPSVPAIRAVFQAEREGIKQLRAKFGRVHVVRINGNHDRTTHKPRSKNQAGTSFGTLLSWWLQTAFEHDPNVTFQVPSSPDALVKVLGWNVLCTHGDRMGSSGGKGFIGTEAAILRGHHQMFKSWSDGGIIPDLILSAHFHTETKTVRGFGNGSMAGFSQYARDLRAIPDAARQWLLFMHDEFKVSHQFSLQLSERPRRLMLDAAA
jgi:hypothetical protein